MRVFYSATRPLLFFAMLCLLPGVLRAQGSESILIDFDSMNDGVGPSQFSSAVTGEGGEGRWIVETFVESGKRTKVVAQRSAIDANSRFLVCVYEGFTGKDIDLSVRFRPLSGKLDQAGGLVWRYKDANNYYIVRANALENNVVLYKMQNGKRTDLKPAGLSLFSYGKPANVPRGVWNSLRVVAKGQLFSVYLNREHLFDVQDETFQGAGKVGLWTKADSVTLFDDLTIAPLNKAH